MSPLPWTGAWEIGSYLNFVRGIWTSTPSKMAPNTLIPSHGSRHHPTPDFLNPGMVLECLGAQAITTNPSSRISTWMIHFTSQPCSDMSWLKGNVKLSMRGSLGGMRGTAWGRSQGYCDPSSGPELVTQVKYLFISQWLHSSLVSTDWIKIFHSCFSGSVNVTLIFIKHS